MSGTLAGAACSRPPRARDRAVGSALSALVLAALLLAVLVAVIVGDQLAGIHRPQRGEPSPLDRVETAS